MAYLTETSTWDVGVYELEVGDPVAGGPSGVSNAPLKNLANRTKYLKDAVDSNASSISSLQTSYSALSLLVGNQSSDQTILSTNLDNVMNNRGLNGLEGELFFYSVAF